MEKRKVKVDMSSKAIDARMREVSQLRKLGLSIAKAKPMATHAKPSEEQLSSMVSIQLSNEQNS